MRHLIRVQILNKDKSTVIEVIYFLRHKEGLVDVTIINASFEMHFNFGIFGWIEQLNFKLCYFIRITFLYLFFKNIIVAATYTIISKLIFSTRSFIEKEN